MSLTYVSGALWVALAITLIAPVPTVRSLRAALKRRAIQRRSGENGELALITLQAIEHESYRVAKHVLNVTFVSCGVWASAYDGRYRAWVWGFAILALAMGWTSRRANLGRDVLRGKITDRATQSRSDVYDAGHPHATERDRSDAREASRPKTT